MSNSSCKTSCSAPENYRWWSRKSVPASNAGRSFREIARRGFSLIEILIVIILIAIAALSITTNSATSAKERLEQAAHHLVSDLDYVRGLAIVNNSRYRTTFDMARNRYLIEHSGTNAALNVLPTAATRSTKDTPTQQFTFLEDMPNLAGRVILAGVTSGGVQQANPASCEFGSLGELTGGQEIVIWIATGQGTGRRYQAVRIDPVSGLATIDRFTATGPY